MFQLSQQNVKMLRDVSSTLAGKLLKSIFIEDLHQDVISHKSSSEALVKSHVYMMRG